MTSYVIGCVCVGALGLALSACGDSTTDGSGGAATTSSSTGASVGDAQTPPEGRAPVEAWLAKGEYKAWHCEAAVHAARAPSPHGFNRICSNNILSSNATGTGVFAKGAAAVKEIYAAMGDTTPVGYAVYLKTDADSAAGANWYWYERVPSDSAAPHDANGVVADGHGGSGTANTICVGCHVAAGSDAMHTPSPNGRDFVYTAVP